WVEQPYQQGVGQRVLDEGGGTGEGREVRDQVGKRLVRADVLDALNLGPRPDRGDELLVVGVGMKVHGHLQFALEVGENLAEVGADEAQSSEHGERKRHGGDGGDARHPVRPDGAHGLRQRVHQAAVYAAMTASVNCSVLASPPRSRVNGPFASTTSIAASMRLDTSASPMWSSIIAAVRNMAVGLATPCPAMSGALPCTGSK